MKRGSDVAISRPRLARFGVGWLRRLFGRLCDMRSAQAREWLLAETVRSVEDRAE